MTHADEWERDPRVTVMRRIFANMEEAQRGLLSSLGIDPQDSRIRAWRERTLPRVERCWRLAAGKGLKMTEQKAAALYIRLLADEMSRDGVRIGPDILVRDQEIEALVKEAS